ncbi:prolyl oligopeptidase [Labrys miyagiensis]|uniref:Prolyl oligopeptidase n=1 Tax=Labrys miyagiensis TaxID=346912 RepID=A0ABQ6CDQ8_9HYPH|nr:prolyl oligopeptidase family serine peptidase [Labrys miyagiensis]GLS18498.1 prolyl oligopeptidase [Labrys miyagiensis]
MTAPDLCPTLAAPDDDPYLWLEEIEGSAALAWVAERSQATMAKFGDAGFAADRDTLTAILDRPDRIPDVTRRGRYLYNFWQDAANPRGVWRRTSFASFATPEPEWELVLDLDALAKEENEDWVWGGSAVEPEEKRRTMLRLSRGGSDAVVHREFDIETRGFPADGFVLPQAKGGIAWLDENTLLLSSALGDGMATTSGYARTVRLWRRGEDPLKASVIFETKPDFMSAWAGVDRTASKPRVWFMEKPAFFETNGWLGDASGPKTRFELPADAHWDAFDDWLVVKPRTPWTPAAQTYAADVLLGIGLSAFQAGSRDFSVLFEPGERRVLDGFFWNKGQLVLSILDNLKPHFEIATPSPSAWRRHPIEALPSTGVVHVWSLDSEDADTNGEMMVALQDPITPPQVSLMDVSDPEALAGPTVLKRGPEVFDANGLRVTQHEAVSVDGEKIPYTQVGPAGETGEAPVHLTGYGGFEVTLQPTYMASVGKLWLERGGTHVMANLRGGGEFGSRWHEAGRRQGKFLSHEDFAAIATDLVRRGVTRPGLIAAEGGSNGGLLIANMLTRHPGKFGALFCTIPLIDMRRYTRLLAGASWIDEYGDPDKPEDWAFLQKISAYHTAGPGSYPPILLATTRRDDRVHPGHARKMAAKLESLGHRVHFYEPQAGGHGYGKDNSERASFIALGYSFLRKAIGWEVGS